MNMARPFAGVAGGKAAGCDRKMPRGGWGRGAGGEAVRRDAGCGEGDSRNVEGEQGHDAGGTIDADGMRPLDCTPAAMDG